MYRSIAKKSMNRNDNSENFSFLTIDMIEKHKKLPYTKKEILQQEYPEFWGGANELVRILRELQNMIVEMLPIYKPALPKTIDQLEDKDSQNIYLTYIKYRILYAFAESVWKRTEQYCQDIAENPIDNDSSKMSLLHSFEVFDEHPLINIVSDDEKGYDMMKEMIDKYDPHIFFGVLQRWGYRDIVGVIQAYGLKHEQLWKDVCADPDPKEASIGELLDDNQTIRFY